MASAAKRKKTGDCHVALGADLVIGGAVELHTQLGKALSEQAPVVLDAAAVTRMDTAGLQLLQAFVQACNDGSREWRWENVGEGLRTAAALLGIEQMLELPAMAPANG
ncbi:MAG: STAS domain-containing protein [Rhodanobacteraceae bacterium]